jgi:tRNA G18 (ribose-2'-O)-methylase SpoU
VSIPMPGEAESLNAGVAGSVLMFEVVRQRIPALTKPS